MLTRLGFEELHWKASAGDVVVLTYGVYDLIFIDLKSRRVRHTQFLRASAETPKGVFLNAVDGVTYVHVWTKDNYVHTASLPPDAFLRKKTETSLVDELVEAKWSLRVQKELLAESEKAREAAVKEKESMEKRMREMDEKLKRMHCFVSFIYRVQFCLFGK